MKKLSVSILSVIVFSFLFISSLQKDNSIKKNSSNIQRGLATIDAVGGAGSINKDLGVSEKFKDKWLYKWRKNEDDSNWVRMWFEKREDQLNDESTQLSVRKVTALSNRMQWVLNLLERRDVKAETDPSIRYSPIVDVKKDGKFEISWSAPYARADGTELKLYEIDRYKVYLYNTTTDTFYETDPLNGDWTSATIEVERGVYRVVLTTIDIDGRESSYSRAVIKAAL